MQGCTACGVSVGAGTQPDLPRLCAEVLLSPLCRLCETGCRSLDTEVTGVFRLLERKRNSGNHILICSPQELRLGSSHAPL